MGNEPTRENSRCKQRRTSYASFSLSFSRSELAPGGSPERNLRKILATAGRVRGGTNLPAESSEFRGKVGSIGDADPDRLAPTLRRNLFRRSNRGRPLFTVAMSCQRFAGNLPPPPPLSASLVYSFQICIREDIPPRGYISILKIDSKRENRRFVLPSPISFFFLIQPAGSGVRSCRDPDNYK